MSSKSKMTSKVFWGFAALAVGALHVEPASACGGFFCSQSAPVNQAAERIIFSENGDGTVTAVIQILYEGPSENFSWLLPISTVPKEGEAIAIASNVAFTRLQAATNPTYNLTTRVEGTCASQGGFGGASAAAGGAPGAGPPNGNSSPGGGVTVAASGIVGAFEWTVIALDASLTDPSDAAVDWLEANGYDVAEGARGLLRPYLEDGLYLLALRLTKGADSGSIRPIALTYDAKEPMIPIKLTAVAANENMGVMTWLLSSARGVPRNYLSLELNEARINWFNASSNYNDVVTAAADEAGGQGFVTEYADATSTLNDRVWSTFDADQWSRFTTTPFDSFAEIFDYSFNVWGAWDGYWDAVRATVTLPNGVTFDDFKACPNCYRDQIQFSPAALIDALEKDVIEPVRMVEELIASRPYVTRLYTTMSAAEMTEDPAFTFNPDLSAVSNVHTAERVIECKPNLQTFQAPWRIELPQGGIIRGQATQTGMWPAQLADQPSNARILQLSPKGEGRVLENNQETIQQMLAAYNDTVPSAGGGGTGNTAGGRPMGGATAMGAASGTVSGGTSSGVAGADDETPIPANRDSGCSVSSRAGSAPSGWWALALGLLASRWGRRVRTGRGKNGRADDQR